MAALPPFKKLKESCDVSSLTYTEPVDKENAFLENFDVVIPCNISLPTKISNNVVLKYTIPASPLFIDPLQIFFRTELQIMKIDEKGALQPIEPNTLVASVIAPLYTMIDKLELFSQGRLVASWNNYGYICFITMLLFYDLSYLKTVLQTQAAFSLDT